MSITHFINEICHSSKIFLDSYLLTTSTLTSHVSHEATWHFQLSVALQSHKTHASIYHPEPFPPGIPRSIEHIQVRFRPHLVRILLWGACWSSFGKELSSTKSTSTYSQLFSWRIWYPRRRSSIHRINNSKTVRSTTYSSFSTNTSITSSPHPHPDKTAPVSNLGLIIILTSPFAKCPNRCTTSLSNANATTKVSKVVTINYTTPFSQSYLYHRP